MEDRWLILFREMAVEKFLDDHINIEHPRTCLMSLIVDFKEMYGKDLLALYEYSDLAEVFAECANIYTAQSLFRFDREKNKFSPVLLQGARRADYRHRQILGDDY